MTVATCLLVLTATSALSQPARLGHPTIDQRIETLQASVGDGYRFAVFGDQKNLWKREFPRLLDRIGAAPAAEEPVLFLIDTGDIVDNGSRPDEFNRLAGLLDRVKHLPYLVGVGNHELKPKEPFETSERARSNAATFLGPDYAADRLYYSKQVGPVRFLFLNTSDLPGVYPELRQHDPEAADRGSAQLSWLAQELQTEVGPTIVVSHHPIMQSATKHHHQARVLWNREHHELGGRTLPEALIESGVDLVLSGHVHSYEVFRLERNNRQMWTLNVSGRPTGWLQGRRMPKDWRADSLTPLKNRGFRTRLDQWAITQEGYMSDADKVDQFALVTVTSDGRLSIELQTADGAIIHRMAIP